MRLIHYSAEPLTEVRSRPHSEDGAGAFKTPGLWVSVEGPDDWAEWCKSESFGFGGFVHATEIILRKDHRALIINSVEGLDKFSAQYVHPHPISRILQQVNWEPVRREYQGLIIAPYQYARRYSSHTFWYYGWDCASGVIWDAEAVAELRPAELPDLFSNKDESPA